MKPVIIIPSNRPEKMNTFMNLWKKEFTSCKVIIVWDLEKIPKHDKFFEETRAAIRSI